MPNWCENKLQIFCDCIQAKQIIPKLFRKTESDKWCLDFELLVPMPESICIESSSLGDRAMEFLKISPNRRLTRPLLKKYIYGSEIDRIYAKAKHHRWDVGHFINWLIKRPEQQSILWLNLALGHQYLSNLAQHGYKDWYDWSNEQWGCKWNVCSDSCQVSFNDNGSINCLFDTPWGPPDGWFQALCTAFPDIEFILSFFEPGMWFAGKYIANLDGSYCNIYIDDRGIRSFAEEVFNEEFEDEFEEKLE
ncbi:TPA: hypothetical protein SIC20_000478 [Pasteurella multocida]|nr:hypothetical protein [Pasteurella multocida]